MPLSSNSLIHFANNIEAIKGILETDFNISYCRERVTLGGKSQEFHVPMVSFCDIPLSEIKEHIHKYGNYAIGMTKDWGMRQGLNPVLYMAQTSFLSDSYRKVWNDMIDASEDECWTDSELATADILRYIKNYEADLTRKGKTIKNYRFSDEREWRYVPPHSVDCDHIISSEWYNEQKNKNEADAKIKSLKLSFDPEDIKYIIISDDKEIGDIVDHLRRAKGKLYSFHELERLTTRILTVEQIKTDI